MRQSTNGNGNASRRRNRQQLATQLLYHDRCQDIGPRRRQVERRSIPAFGDKWNETDEDAFRYVFHNLDGIHLGDDGNEWGATLAILDEGDARVVGVAEPNLNFARSQTYYAARRIIKRVHLRAKVATSSSGEHTQGHYQPGGTITIASGKIASKAQESGADPLGRWSFITTLGKAGRKITYVTVYQACKNQAAGPKTWFSQLRRRMFERNDKDPKPREALMRELQAFIQELRREGNHFIVLGIDANEEMTPGSMIDDVRLHCGRVDPQDAMHGNNPHPTYARGSKRIDRILVSQELLPAVIRAGTLGHHDLGIVSDHMTMFVSFNERMMYNGSIADLLKVENRDVVSTIPSVKAKCLEVLHEQIEERNLFQRMNDVEASEEYNEAQQRYNSVARDLIAACKVAGKRCRRRSRRTFPFSPKLKNAMERVQYWRTRKSCNLNSLALPAHLLESRTRLKISDNAGMLATILAHSKINCFAINLTGVARTWIDHKGINHP